MFSKKSVIITIGSYGAIVALHGKRAIKNKFFLEKLNETSIVKLQSFFAKNKSATVTILLDTLDQSYKRKTYPLLRKGDLVRLIKRDMLSDGDKDSLKSFIILDPKKSSKPIKSAEDTKVKEKAKWECLFAAASVAESVNDWLDFLPKLPNRLIGIYMLPIESFNLLKKIRVKTKNKKDYELHCLVTHNKVSGVRQTVFSEQGIVFTRIIDYDFKADDFLKKYERDIYSSFEYLKRIFPNVSIAQLKIINILPKNAINLLENLGNIEFNLTNYTPFEAASRAGYGKILSPNASFCDLIISKTALKEKKILKFVTPKIAAVERFFLTLSISYYLNIILLIAVLAAGSLTALDRNKINNSIKDSKIQKSIATVELKNLQKNALGGSASLNKGKKINIGRAVDIGKIETTLKKTEQNLFDLYAEIKFLKSFGIKITKFSYSLVGFNEKFPPNNVTKKFGFIGEIINESGDIEDLFTEFDNLTLEVKKNFKKDKVTYSEIPRNIDFNQKYYGFPIDFSISQKK